MEIRLWLVWAKATFVWEFVSDFYSHRNRPKRNFQIILLERDSSEHDTTYVIVQNMIQHI